MSNATHAAHRSAFRSRAEHRRRRHPAKTLCHHVADPKKINALVEAAGLSSLPADSRIAVADMVEWVRTTRRRHKLFPEAVAIDWKLWRSQFRRTEISQVQQALFTLPRSNLYPPGYSCEAHGIAIAYQLRPEIELVASRWDGLMGEQSTVLIEGNRFRRPIIDGALIRTDPLNDLPLPSIPRWVPINLDAVRWGIRAVTDWIDWFGQFIGGSYGMPWLYLPFDEGPSVLREEVDRLFTDQPHPVHARSVLMEIRRDLRRIEREAGRNPEHPDAMIQLFHRVSCGRWVGTGFNLQNRRRIVRRLALHGFHQVDATACHPTIWRKIAERNGVPCSGIDFVVDHADQYRHGLAQHISGNVRQAKQATLAVTYSAPSNGPALGRIFGTAEERRHAFEFGPFDSYYRDVRQLRPIIDKLRFIGPDEGETRRPTLRKRTARITLGIESEVLHAGLTFDPEAVLPLHDGWTTRSSVDVDELSDRIEQATGYRLAFTTEPIRVAGCPLGIANAGL